MANDIVTKHVSPLGEQHNCYGFQLRNTVVVVDFCVLIPATNSCSIQFHAHPVYIILMGEGRTLAKHSIVWQVTY